MGMRTLSEMSSLPRASLLAALLLVVLPIRAFSQQATRVPANSTGSFDVSFHVKYKEFLGEHAQGLKTERLVGDREWLESDGLFQMRPDSWLFRMIRHGNTEDVVYRNGKYYTLLRSRAGKALQAFEPDYEPVNWTPGDFLGAPFNRRQGYGQGHSWNEILDDRYQLKSHFGGESVLVFAPNWQARIGLTQDGKRWKYLGFAMSNQKGPTYDWTITDWQTFGSEPFPKKARFQCKVYEGQLLVIDLEALITFGKPVASSKEIDFHRDEGLVTNAGRKRFITEDGKQEAVEDDYGSYEWEQRVAARKRLMFGGITGGCVGVLCFLVYRRKRRVSR